MEPKTLREFLIHYHAQTSGAYNKIATRGDVYNLGIFILNMFEEANKFETCRSCGKRKETDLSDTRAECLENS